VATIELDHRECVLTALREEQRHSDVIAADRRVPLVLHPLVVERPADLLAVVRERQMPEDGTFRCHAGSLAV
jgi:hypothetical protein